MAKSKYSQYVLTEPKPNRPLPPLPKNAVTDLIYLDDEVIKGAFNLICAWFWPRKDRMVVIPEAHTHTSGEVVAFFGSNPADPHDLGGEIEFWLGDEPLILTKSCAVYAPPGVKHNPLIFRRIDRPIFHFSTLPETMYTLQKS